MKKKKIIGKLEIPEGILKGFYIEIFNRNELVLTGDTEVKELEDSVLKLICGDDIVEIKGEKIKVEDYSYSGIRVTGDLKELTFDKIRA